MIRNEKEVIHTESEKAGYNKGFVVLLHTYTERERDLRRERKLRRFELGRQRTPGRTIGETRRSQPWDQSNE